MESGTKTITLEVPNNYILPSYFNTAEPWDIASALDVASRLPAFLGSEAEKMDVTKCVRVALREVGHTEVERVERIATEKMHHLENLLEEKGAKLLEMTVLQQQAVLEKNIMQRTFDERVDAARALEAIRAKEVVQTAVEDAHTKTMKLEEELCSALKERCVYTEEASKTISALQTRISELETPMGRGNVGELEVAQCLADMGFVVEDTSTGEAKNAGYMDLLIYPESSQTGHPKIALEIKNRKVVQRENITSFQEHTRNGIAKGIFDSAIFVSIRAHVKREASSALDMYDDDLQRPLIPVSWIGPERSKNAHPLTSDQLEAHVMLHCALLSETTRLREVFDKQADSATEDDKKQVQMFIESMAMQVNEIFADLMRQHKIIDEMKKNLTNVRVKAIHMFTDMCSVNASVSWLRRPVNAPWLSVFEKARAKVATHSDAQIWNECSNGKQAIERVFGKDAMMKALRDEPRKRERDLD